MSIKLQAALSILFFATGVGAGLLFLPDGATEHARGSKGSGSKSVVSVQIPWQAALGGRPRFTDVTLEAGVVFRHENGLTGEHVYIEIMGGGVCVVDYDLDGLLDLYFVNGNHLGEKASSEITNRLYRNLGNWKFEDVTAKAGVADSGYGQGCCVGDYDNDGDPDLFVSNYGPNVLYRNNGDGTFTNVTELAALGDPGWGQSCSFLDFDRDGWLDLYVQNYLAFLPTEKFESFVYVGKRQVRDYPSPLGFKGAADRLFHNQGNGTFRDVTKESGLFRENGKGMGVACVDVNDDGWVDVFVSNDSAENFLFLGGEGGKFTEAGLVSGVAFNGEGVPEASMGVDVGDYDRDGRPDMIVPCLHRQFFTLYRNRGGYFHDESVSTGLAAATARFTGFNANFLDYDNDGDLDLYFSNGEVRMNQVASPEDSYAARYGTQDLLLAHDGKSRYVDVSDHAGSYFERELIGRGSAIGDFDNDGDFDLVISNLADHAILLRNDTEGGNWITLNLVGVEGRKNPVGTKISVDAGDLKQREILHGKVTYLSQSDRRPHFGVGKATIIDKIEIRWPSGKTRVLEKVAVNRFIEIREVD